MDILKTARSGLFSINVCVLVMTIAITLSRCQEVDDLQMTAGLPTVTVRGFLNFKTTVGGTVIVFTPAADLPKTVENIQQTTRPIDRQSVLSTNLLVPQGNVLESRDVVDPAQMQELDFSRRSDESLQSDIIGDFVHLDHKAKAPLLQHISDNAVIPSTAHTDNDLETSSARKDSSTYNHYPTGLVTVLDGTRVQDGKTTIFETKVIGTYIDGKYAQILQSTSKIIVPKSFYTPSYRSVGSTSTSPELLTEDSPSTSYSTTAESQSVPVSTSTITSTISSDIIKPTSVSSRFSESTILTTKSLETLKTHVTTLSSSSHLPAVATTSRISPITTSSRSPETFSSSSKSHSYMSIVTPTATHSRASWIMKSASGKPFTNTYIRPQLQSSFPSSPKLSSSFSENTEKSHDSSKKTPTLNLVTSEMTTTSRTFHRSSSTAEEDYETVFLKSSNLRLSSTVRTRFSAPRRPSQSVKLNRFKVKLTLRQNSTDGGDMTTPSADETTDPEDDPEEEDISLETTTEDDLLLDVDPAHVVYQETTITSKVTLHVGRRKSIRTLTITTSVPMRISPTEDTEVSMMTTTTHSDDLKHDNEAEENAPATHSVISRTFTSTERTHTTSVVPVFDGTQTTYHTLTESLFIMKIVTAYKTLPPTDYTVLAAPQSTDPDIEIVTDNVTVLDVAANVQPSIVEKLPPEQMSAVIPEILQPSIAAVPIQAANNGINNPILSFGQAFSNNPLAAVYLGLQQLNAQMTLYSTITQTSTFVTTDTIYTTKVIRFYDGRSTRYRTMSDPVSTKERTVTTAVTKVHPYINTQAYQQQQQLQKLIAPTQLPTPPQQQFRTVTTTYTTATTATSYSTRIYTLIYNGFSTKFRTVTSSKVYPTTLTITSTKEVPVITAQPQLVPFAYPYPAAK